MSFAQIDRMVGWAAPVAEAPRPTTTEKRAEGIPVDPKTALLLAGLLSGSGVVVANVLRPYMERRERRKRRERIIDMILERAEQAKMARHSPAERITKLAHALSR